MDGSLGLQPRTWLHCIEWGDASRGRTDTGLFTPRILFANTPKSLTLLSISGKLRDGMYIAPIFALYYNLKWWLAYSTGDARIFSALFSEKYLMLQPVSQPRMRLSGAHLRFKSHISLVHLDAIMSPAMCRAQ